jgi:hypothetical protein
MRKFYFVTLTNTTVVVSSMNRMTNRPGDVIYTIPREQFKVVSVKRGAFWSSMLVLQGEQKPTRLNRTERRPRLVRSIRPDAVFLVQIRYGG